MFFWVPALFGATLTVSPSYFEFEGQPGHSVSQTLTIHNSSDSTQRIKIYTGDFWYDKEYKRSFPEAGTTQFSAASWVTIKSPELEVPSRSQTNIEFIFAIPLQPKLSGYASLFVEQLPPSDSKHGSVGLSLRIAVPLLFRRPGLVLNKIGIENFAVKKPTAFHPMVLSFLLSNDEEQYAFPEGSVIVVTGGTKEFVSKGELKRDRIILPHQKLKMELPMSIDNKVGKYEGVLSLFYGNGASSVRNFSFSLP